MIKIFFSCVVRICEFVGSLFLIFGASFAAQAVTGQPGTLDATWASASTLGPGRGITPISGGGGYANAMALQPDGKVVLAGYCGRASLPSGFCALRYNGDGTVDESFGGSGTGYVITPFNGIDDQAFAVAVQSDGKILLAGHCFNGSNNDFCTLRYLSNGILDPAFGGGTGKVKTAISIGYDTAYAMTLQPDGKIVVVGACRGLASGSDFCALRYQNDGSLDLSFGGTASGKVVTPVGSGFDTASSVVLQPDGKLLLVGNCVGATTYDFCALRYHTNGTLDTSFGTSGKVITPVSSGSDYANAVALQPDGKVLLVGSCDNGSGYDFCALRYHADGTLDATFGSGGTIITTVGGGEDQAYGAALQPDGKVLLSGSCFNGINFDFCALRYTPSGVVDTTFGIGGMVVTAVGADHDSGAAVTLQADGKILLAGQCNGSGAANFCAVRYEGGPFGYKNCSLDIDGDGQVLAMTDSLIHARIALGITGDSVVAGITFAAHAQRKTWAQLQPYLVSQCGMSLPPP